MFKLIKSKSFANGMVYALKTEDGYPIEVTDTFLPLYTKYANNNNKLCSEDVGNRNERWMIGVSCMSGCPVGCKFCATGQLPRWRKLTSSEIVEQVEFVLSRNENYKFENAKEHKINYTRMGEPFLNIDAVKSAIQEIDSKYPNTHHYISTIGINKSDFSWIKGNITLQISLHSLDSERRDSLIPFKGKISIKGLGEIRTLSNLKTTLNLTLVDRADFEIELLKKYFDSDKFFIKLSPINKNEVSEKNECGGGIIKAKNLI